MVDDFTRPYVDESGAYLRLVYLTDAQLAEARKHRALRPLRPGEVISPPNIITPEVEGETQIAPFPSTRQAADTVLGDPVAHPVPEVREREVP